VERYLITCRIENEVWRKDIRCREMTIKDGAYRFWTGEYGTTNRLIWAFPVAFTIIENASEEN
jgi:hypothetical protein